MFLLENFDNELFSGLYSLILTSKLILSYVLDVFSLLVCISLLILNYSNLENSVIRR